jgi:hypothetical protein
MPAALARLITVVPMLRLWSTTTRVRPSAAALAKTASNSASRLSVGTLNPTIPSDVSAHALCESLPTSTPMKTSYTPDASMMLSSNRVGWSDARFPDTHITEPRPLGVGHVPISRGGARHPGGGNTPRAFARGRGLGPSVGGRPAAPLGHHGL